MFTKKPEAGDSVTKMGERQGGESASKMIPSIIGEGLTITGNVASKGEIQVDGEIQGDIHCGSLLLGDTAQVVGDVIAEDIVVRGRVVGSIRGVRVTLQALSHIEGDIIHQSLAIEQGAYFEGKSRRTDNPLEEVKASSAGSPRPVHKPSDFDFETSRRGERAASRRIRRDRQPGLHHCVRHAVQRPAAKTPRPVTPGKMPINCHRVRALSPKGLAARDDDSRRLRKSRPIRERPRNTLGGVNPGAGP